MLSSLISPSDALRTHAGLFSHDRDFQSWFQITLHFGSPEKQNPCSPGGWTGTSLLSLSLAVGTKRVQQIGALQHDESLAGTQGAVRYFTPICAVICMLPQSTMAA